MARPRRRTAGALLGGLACVLAVLPLAGAAEARTPADAHKVAESNTAKAAGSMVMVLDSSGSMADDDGSGSTRIASARKAVGTVADSLPDGYPTGLRVYGADKARGCTDTRLAEPVKPLDRTALKKAVAGVKPKGDTPIGHSLKKAAQDLPRTPHGAIGQRTILLISDGEDNCGAPPPCEVAESLAEKGIDLRIDAIGFQVRGKARKQLECVAGAGKGHYYDAPDAKALARQLQRAGRLSADGYRFKGERVTGGPKQGAAAPLGDGSGPTASGQYVDTIGPGEKRYYRVGMDKGSTTTFSATGVPQPGSKVDSLDGLRTEIISPENTTPCESNTTHFSQSEGGVPLVSSSSRIPGDDGRSGGTCDWGAGRYLLAVERTSKKGSDSARWPLELSYTVEQPLKKGLTPAQSMPELGAAGEGASLPQGTPRKVTGGTGFNDAKTVGTGVWRDKLLPSQTLWYRVPVGWGQQVRYDVEFSNEPTADEYSSGFTRIATQVYGPGRQPVSDELTGTGAYTGKPDKISAGTPPVSWTNRWESAAQARPVHAAGDYYIAVTLGAKASQIAENPDIGVTLRLDVKGTAKSGPQHGAPAAKAGAGASAGGDADGTAPRADKDGDGSAGWSGAQVAAVAGGTGVLLLAGLGLWYVLARRGGNGPGPGGPADGWDPTRGGAR
ncbi:VWA domain-containing protein [Streptomyces sp. NPDC048172]|uniref:vWA domain-containing protein n=1 Tax=Streptomyces sp. NPDC048172 TaxID=3365505 RepID=UPI00371D1932